MRSEFSLNTGIVHSFVFLRISNSEPNWLGCFYRGGEPVDAKRKVFRFGRKPV